MVTAVENSFIWMTRFSLVGFDFARIRFLSLEDAVTIFKYKKLIYRLVSDLTG